MNCDKKQEQVTSESHYEISSNDETRLKSLNNKGPMSNMPTTAGTNYLQ